MNDKEFDEIMQKYVESTRPNKDIALKKLNQKPDSEKRTHKKLKPQFICAAVMCSIILALCIALPITLIDSTSNGLRHYSVEDVSFKIVENIDVVKNEYGITVKYPTVKPDVVYSVSTNEDNFVIGVMLELWVFDVKIFNAEFVAVSKSHILDKYEKFFNFSILQQWSGYTLSSYKTYDFETLYYSKEIYFSDNKYDYFLTIQSEEDLQVTEIMDILYR